MKTMEERLKELHKKEQQIENRKILQENRKKQEADKLAIRQKIAIGEMFMESFPLAASIPITYCTKEELAPLRKIMEEWGRTSTALLEMEDWMNNILAID